MSRRCLGCWNKVEFESLPNFSFLLGLIYIILLIGLVVWPWYKDTTGGNKILLWFRESLSSKVGSISWMFFVDDRSLNFQEVHDLTLLSMQCMCRGLLLVVFMDSSFWSHTWSNENRPMGCSNFVSIHQVTRYPIFGWHIVQQCVDLILSLSSPFYFWNSNLLLMCWVFFALAV